MIIGVRFDSHINVHISCIFKIIKDILPCLLVRTDLVLIKQINELHKQYIEDTQSVTTST